MLLADRPDFQRGRLYRCASGGTDTVQGGVRANSSPKLTWAGLLSSGTAGGPCYGHGTCCGTQLWVDMPWCPWRIWVLLGEAVLRLSMHVPISLFKPHPFHKPSLLQLFKRHLRQSSGAVMPVLSPVWHRLRNSHFVCAG